jgi:hypothetical protein
MMMLLSREYEMRKGTLIPAKLNWKPNKIATVKRQAELNRGFPPHPSHLHLFKPTSLSVLITVESITSLCISLHRLYYSVIDTKFP